MAGHSIEVTYEAPDPTRIPDALSEGAAFFVDLEHRGVLGAVGEQVRIRRQGGYCGLDVWLLLLLFFTAGSRQGVRLFWDLVRPHAERLGALAGRRRLPSPASLSRALDAVEVDLVRPVAGWLLAGPVDTDRLLRHPAMQSYDTQGDSWHVFDLDPTVTTLRHRALPADGKLPEPRRRSEDTAAPGYSGRKRGNVQFRRVTVQHAGSGAWVHAHLSQGNGEGVVDFERALDAVATTCDRVEHPRARALTRMDGEYGNVPWYTACRERGLPFITRLNRPVLYEDPEMLLRLRQATWYRVSDSLSGPQRAAAELGTLTVHPDSRTTRTDGSRYAPVTVRVVASIFPKTSKAKRGRTLDGWQVELFAVDLPVDAWPAPEAVTAYFGRAGQENRFGQEDRELGLDRIVSYGLPGQELATLVGLSVWNLRLVRGFDLAPPSYQRPALAPRDAVVDLRVEPSWPPDPVITTALAEANWPLILRWHPGWGFDPDSGQLRCPDDRLLALTTVRPRESSKGRTPVIFRRPAGGCEACSSRKTCLRSARRAAAKHIELTFPTAVAATLRSRLARVRAVKRPAGPSVSDTAGPWAVTAALFLPASARHAHTATFLAASLRVEVALPDKEPRRLELLAADVADRQHRRKTWIDNVARYALPPGARVRVTVEGSAAFRRMTGEPQPSEESAASAA